MSDGLDVKAFITGYLAEAGEHLSSANALLMAIDASQKRRESNPKAVRELFRALHTLKGLSAMVGAEGIVDITHELETLLRAADKAGGRLPQNAVDLMLKGVRAVEERVAALGRGAEVAPAPKALIEELSSLNVDEGSVAGTAAIDLAPELAAKLSVAEHAQLAQGLARGQKGRAVEFRPSAERAAAGISITSVRERVGKLGELVKVVPRAAGGAVSFVLIVLTTATDEALCEAAAATKEQLTPIALTETAAAAAAEPVEDAPVQHRDWVRVEVQRLDDALERLSVLVVTRSKLDRAVKKLEAGVGDLRALKAIVAENARQLRDLRGAIMRARMVRVSELLERAPLIVRGLSRASGKPVQLDVQAGDAELDKTVADRLFPVIVHLLRNAVDHALERPEDRKAIGKPEEGRITITCSDHASRELELRISDDGRGIDRQRVARRAGAPVPQTDAELLELICRPGLSTMEVATQTSGRGIGMDVVRKTTLELGGELTVSSTPGSGTTFTVRVPLSVTIVDAFTFVCGGETFVVPVSAVDDLTELDRTQVIEPPEGKKNGGARVQLFRHRGAAIPLYPLGAMLGFGAEPGSEHERPKVIVTRKGAEAMGFQVDRMVGKQEIAVRPVTDPLVMAAGVAGSTDLGDGRPTLVLDLAGLAARHSLRKVMQ
ncbi:MAG: chemotaxis protein CheW [Myxococcaceae bacterium]|nr:chemotaxis protein CheW [Myxococcaceae bacterium]